MRGETTERKQETRGDKLLKDDNRKYENKQELKTKIKRRNEKRKM